MKKDEQANVLLSLKNLYRLFTVKDYPVYSTGILGEKSKKGLTLVRFWDEYLLYEWKSTRHGKMIFRKDGSQNRYHSEFCNRKESFPLYQVYLQEVLECLNAETFGSQILIFEKFLKEKNYNHSVFVQKMRKFSGHGHGIRSMAVPRVWRKVDFLDQLHREKTEGFFPDPLGLPGSLPCFVCMQWQVRKCQK